MNWRNWIPFSMFFRPEPTTLQVVKEEVNKLIQRRDYHAQELFACNAQITMLHNWVIGEVK